MGYSNLYTSRRTFKLSCKWYKALNNDVKLQYDENPSGYFKARWETARSQSNSMLGGVVQVQQSQLTLLTCDIVDGLGRNDKVVCMGEDYLVTDVQQRMIKKQSEYLKGPSVMTYITLRK